MKQASIYGIFFLLLVSLSGCGQKNTSGKKEVIVNDRLKALIPPKPRGWVSDFEKIFTQEQVSYLDSIIGEHEEKTSDEMAVVSLQLDSTVIHSLTEFDTLSTALFNTWGVGKKEKNNGVAILFSVHLKKVRIEVGYGLEAKLTDKEAKYIIDDIILPEFRKGDYFTGIVNAVNRIFKETE